MKGLGGTSPFHRFTNPRRGKSVYSWSWGSYLQYVWSTFSSGPLAFLSSGEQVAPSLVRPLFLLRNFADILRNIIRVSCLLKKKISFVKRTLLLNNSILSYMSFYILHYEVFKTVSHKKKIHIRSLAFIFIT